MNDEIEKLIEALEEEKRIARMQGDWDLYQDLEKQIDRLSDN